ncbi:hypothetical protein ATE92_1743 [Ulvibacter sp. MAR_2010_11]|uniref:hypothetical protein n=1 Tax=Ulvibacter sp. MAR_2010_11 TaxID=1250229 RepID=UPI000C2C727D|nr:hypothetical protein [Ulvibacter sp. MAR_2010_11]PKA83586.1 hypothetical protein ATE92_1743 [Ulvibacter sp. MAR_2010_11]
MKIKDQILHEEMRKLISKSCASRPDANSDYYSFQKALLKFFFNAADVQIDYDTQTISLWTSNTTKQTAGNLYGMNDVVTVKISYTNLEDTLKGCLERGVSETRFYTSMLFHYNHVAGEEPVTNAKSA